MKLRRPHQRKELPIRAVEIAAENQEPSSDIRPFDPRVDMSLADFDGIKREGQKEAREFNDLYALATKLMTLAICFPEHRSALDIDNNTYDTLIASLPGYYVEDSNMYADLALAVTELFPDRLEVIDEQMYQNLKMKYDRLAQYGECSYGIINIAHAICVLYPEHRVDLEMDKDVFQRMLQYMKMNSDRQHWKAYSSCAAMLRVIFPEHSADLEVDEQAWKGMKEEFEEERDHSDTGWINSHILARNMTILAADRVDIENRRIILTNKEPLEQGRSLPPRNLAA